VTELVVVADAEAAARRVADQLAWRLADARRRDRPFHVALAGGDTPRRAYELLGAMEGSWDHAHLWLGDERCVPRDHPDSNARMVDESLYAHARAQPPMLHPMTELRGSPEDAAYRYTRALEHWLPDLTFDLVLLGLGEDGHTASLFPHHHALEAVSVPCLAVRDAPKPPPQRITLTIPMLRHAEHTILLTAGEAKREPLRRALAGPDPATPASLLGDGLDQVICDAAADPR
jgi:6-phosphogluconolactonase